MAHTGTRLHEIDGIRGWAALSVLVYHMYIELFLKAWPQMNGFVPRLLVHGPLAVSVFFVLSGDALSSGYFSGGQRALDTMVIKRYLRLTVPILLSCSVVWLLLQAGLVLNVEAGYVLKHEDWLGHWLTFKPTLVSMLHYALYKVYVSHDNLTSYNPFLWTMSVELAGSVLVFLYLYLHHRLRRPRLVLVCLSLFAFALKSFYCLFFIGVLLGMLRRDGVFERMKQSRPWRFAAVALVALCALVDAWNLTGPNLGGHVDMVLGPLLVLAFYSTPAFIRFFSSGLSRYLGDISFSLYLIHFAVLISFTSWLTVNWLSDGIFSPAIMLAIATASTVVSMGAATLLWQIEMRLQRHVSRLPAVLFKPAT